MAGAPEGLFRLLYMVMGWTLFAPEWCELLPPLSISVKGALLCCCIFDMCEA